MTAVALFCSVGWEKGGGKGGRSAGERKRTRRGEKLLSALGLGSGRSHRDGRHGWGRLSDPTC